MNKAALAIWLALPLGAWAYHEGPGQDGLALDEVDRLVADAVAARNAEDWAGAVEHFDAALEQLPPDHTDAARRIRLERDQAWMQVSMLPKAHQDLKRLVQDLLDDEAADPVLLDRARAALANAQYYMTWLMRLEGEPRERWEPEIEAARQTYRLLAERAVARGDSDAEQSAKGDLESAIRLARMELSDLQGLPLPSP